MNDYSKILKANYNHGPDGRFTSAVDIGPREVSAVVATSGGEAFTPGVSAQTNPDSAEGKDTINSTGTAITSDNQGVSADTQGEGKQQPSAVFDTGTPHGRRVVNGFKQLTPRKDTQYSGGLERTRNPKYAAIYHK